MTAKQLIILDGITLELNKLQSTHPFSIAISPSQKKPVERANDVREDIIKNNTPSYGITTMFGNQTEITPDDLITFNREVLTQHGPRQYPEGSDEADYIDPDVVRMAAVIHLNQLVKGFAPIRWELIKKLENRLNTGTLPQIEKTGSIGEADLIPMAQLNAEFAPDLMQGEALALMSTNAMSTARLAKVLIDSEDFIRRFSDHDVDNVAITAWQEANKVVNEEINSYPGNPAIVASDADNKLSPPGTCTSSTNYNSSRLARATDTLREALANLANKRINGKNPLLSEKISHNSMPIPSTLSVTHIASGVEDYASPFPASVTRLEKLFEAVTNIEKTHNIPSMENEEVYTNLQDVVDRTDRFLKNAILTAALSQESLVANTDALQELALLPIRNSAKESVSREYRYLLEGSHLLDGENTKNLQPFLSKKVSPDVIASAAEALESLQNSINSRKPPGQIKQKLSSLAKELGNVVVISNTRTTKLLDGEFSGLPSGLSSESGKMDGLYTRNFPYAQFALRNEAVLDADFNPMSTMYAKELLNSVLGKGEKVIAIEGIVATRAIELKKLTKKDKFPEKLKDAISAFIAASPCHLEANKRFYFKEALELISDPEKSKSINPLFSEHREKLRIKESQANLDSGMSF